MSDIMYMNRRERVAKLFNEHSVTRFFTNLDGEDEMLVCIPRENYNELIDKINKTYVLTIEAYCADVNGHRHGE